MGGPLQSATKAINQFQADKWNLWKFWQSETASNAES